MIKSQITTGKGYEYFAEPTIADANLARIVPKAHLIDDHRKRYTQKFKAAIN